MSLMKNRNFAILVSGQVVSTLGNNLYGLALPWYVYTLTNSKSALALTGIAETLPAVVGLFAGVLVDRWRKRKTMIVSDIIRAIINFILFVCVINHSSLWPILTLVLVLQVAGQFFSPASSALFPLLVNKDEVASGSGIMQSSNAAAKLAGTISGGALMAALGASLLFLLNAVSFLMSVASLFFVRVKESQSTSKREDAREVTQSDGARSVDDSQARKRDKSPIATFFRDWLDGVTLAAKSKYLVLTTICALVTNASLAPFELALTAWVKGSMHGSAFDLGVITAGLFVGIIVGGVVLGKLSKMVSQRVILSAGLSSIGVLTAGFGLFHRTVEETALSVILGFTLGCLNGSLNATFINLIPQSMRGRIFGFLGATSMVAAPLGIAIFGSLMVHISLQLLFVLIGAMCLLSGLSVMLPIPDDKERLLAAAMAVQAEESLQM